MELYNPKYFISQYKLNNSGEPLNNKPNNPDKSSATPSLVDAAEAKKEKEEQERRDKERLERLNDITEPARMVAGNPSDNPNSL